MSREEPDGLRVLEELRKLKGVLTSPIATDFACRGGIVRFVVKRDRLSLEVNQLAAADAELKISAQLLDLAKARDFEKWGGKTL